MNPENNDGLVSIIMPVFNAEKYLPRSISSVQNQLYSRWELIIIDDGSSDQSLAVIRNYCKKDKRIKLITNSHGGAAAARNSGLKAANGEYIAFLDADDAYHPTFLSHIITAMLQSKADIGMCQFIRGENADCFLADTPVTEFEIKTAYDTLSEMYGTGWSFIIAPVTKIYDATIFREHRVQFPAGLCFEDVATIFLPLYYADKIVITKTPLYYYNVTPESASVTRRSKELLDREKAIRKHWEFYQKEGQYQLACQAAAFYLMEMITLYYRILQSDHPEDSKIVKSQFEKAFRQYKNKISFTESQNKMIEDFRHPALYGISQKIKKDGLLNSLIGFIRRKIWK